ncbi:MAG: amino acid adenylation domain-containing protein [Actinomycetota bacterium]|nr:amino acid adenylation domain-containing protein [Actinomycetota bacterium]
MSFSITTDRATAPRARTLLDIFNATANRCGDRVAIDAADATLTYSQLADRAGGLARRLIVLGIGPGDRVGVQVQSGTSELYVAILGVLLAGAAYVPVDADDPPVRAAEIVERSGACVVVRDRLAIDQLATPRCEDRQLSVEDDAWVIFTSGSTGAPKGVAVSHRSAAAFVDAEARLWNVNREDRVLAGLSVGFDASCEEIWLAWRNGAALVPAPRSIVRAGSELGPWLGRRGVTVVSSVPTLAAMWDDASLADVRLLILGGEACPEPLAWRLAAGREVWNTYGPTEATVVSTAARIQTGQQVTIGWPLDGWETAILDDGGEPVQIGEPGELLIAGAGVARYLDPVLDAERFAPVPALGWERAYCTGDVVRETADGLVFVGRLDHQVKIGGRRIEFGEIDGQLHDIPGVKAAVTDMRESSAGNKLLVAYIVGEVDPTEVRAAMAERLPQALVPLIVRLDELPQAASGKVDRKALPWPAPASVAATSTAGLSGTAGWLAERWTDQLGPVEIMPGSDFFELGGSSLVAAKLTSALRERFPAVAVADVYNHRRLDELSNRLDELGSSDRQAPTMREFESRRWGAIRAAGALALLALGAPQWLLGILAFDRIAHVGPQVGWAWLIVGWLVFTSAPGRVGLVLAARRLLLADLRPGRYPRGSWVASRIWFVERLAELAHLETLAGTPWAARYARIMGHSVAAGARLGTLPPPTSLVKIGERATLEPDVDLHGWWIDGQELVIDELRIAPDARVGTRAVLMPGASIGAGAEVEAGTVVIGHVPAGQRWAGSPGRQIGRAGDGWPEADAPAMPARRRLKAIYAAGLALQSVVPLLASVPGILLLGAFAPGNVSVASEAMTIVMIAPLLALCFVSAYAVLIALAVRLASPLIKAGWHRDDGIVGWVLWFSESLMNQARSVLFPVYSSLYTRPWLRLAGIEIGKRTEISTAVGLNRLSRFGEGSFATDDVVLAGAKARGGWLYVAPIEVGNRSFLGNGAILEASTRLGDDSLVGVLTRAPTTSTNGTSWFGSPALELPRVADRFDPARTTNPPGRLVAARAAMELIRILLPATVSTMLAGSVFLGLSAIGTARGLWPMVLAAPVALIGAGVTATLITIAIKWVLMGRYHAGEHPLYSLFVWRDEIVNTCQDQLAGAWLLRAAVATPIVSAYMRMMGATVGRNVWLEALTVTEFDLAELGDGCVVNRNAVIETHLFHDRLMRIGPAKLGPGATLGPAAAMLPDTTIGAQCSVGARSVVMRGEQLPAHTRWHGVPVVAT